LSHGTSEQQGRADFPFITEAPNRLNHRKKWIRSVFPSFGASVMKAMVRIAEVL
jgi:hypothetical protein